MNPRLGNVGTMAASLSLAGMFRRSAFAFASRAAVVWEGGALTYKSLDERSSRLANAFASIGLVKGDRIAVLSETRREYVETYLAAAKLGLTVVALNIRLHPEELAYCTQMAEPKLLVSSGGLAPVAEAFRAQAPSIEHHLLFDRSSELDYRDYELFLSDGAATDPRVFVDSEDIHNVLYTSGTTGRPKGAVISNRAAVTRAARIAQYWRLGEEDGFVGWLPLFHCGGDESLYATLLSGGKYYTVPKVEPERLYRAISSERLTWTLLLPGMLTDFLRHPARSSFDLSSIRFTFGYANMLSPQILIELTTALNAPYWDAFGQTETSYLVAYGKVGIGEVPTLRKTPTPLMEVAIVDEDMQEMPVGVPGECVVRGPSVMSGYLKDSDATEAVFRGGWLHTGDLLTRNEDGSLTFTDRKKYLIKTGGENVYPAEVERVIGQLEAVQEVCVIGVPDQEWGESVKALVVTRPGYSLIADDVVAWCRQNLASYKKPRYVEFILEAEVPRSTTGKILRDQLARRPIQPGQRVDTSPAR